MTNLSACYPKCESNAMMRLPRHSQTCVLIESWLGHSAINGIIFTLIASIVIHNVIAQSSDEDVKCSELQVGQYVCKDPIIDPDTQSAKGCTKDRIITVDCMPVAGTVCDGEFYNGSTTAPDLKRDVPCRYTNGYSYNTALLLSIFLGMFGVDRLYLGYPALALLKFCTIGLLFVGHFLDVLLIAMQVVNPSDGSDYIIDYYGPVLQRTTADNATYLMPTTD